MSIQNIRLEVMQLLEKKIDSFMEEFLIPVEKIWQPTDLLPNLQGENYAFLCCPQLSTMLNTGSVKNIFARISLDQSPGTMVFSYLSNPKVFDAVPLNQLNDLEFSILNYDGTEYEFNDLDYSFTLQITETIDVTDGFQVSSRRGITDN